MPKHVICSLAMFLHTCTHKQRVKYIKHLIKLLSYEGNKYKLCPAMDWHQLNLSCAEHVVGVGSGQLSAAGDRGQQLLPWQGRFAPSWGLRSGQCGKAAAGYYSLLLFHTGTDDDARGNQHWLHGSGVWGVGCVRGFSRAWKLRQFSH